MRLVIYATLLVMLTGAVSATEIVLDSCYEETMSGVSLFPHVFGGKSEIILQQSDDTREGEIDMDEVAIAQWFVSPAHCRVTKIVFFNRYYGTKTVAVWLDSGGAPSYPGGEYGNVSRTFTGENWMWDNPVHMVDLDIELYFGVKFWAGIHASPGRDPYIGIDKTNPDKGHARNIGSGWQWYGGQDIMVRVYLNDDWDPPYINGRDPASGATGVPYDSNIVYHVKDDDAGIKSGSVTSDTLVVTDDSKGVVTGDYSANYTDLSDITVTFDPHNDFAENAVITVTVSPVGHEIEDAVGNVMPTDSWSFTVTSAGIESASLGEIKANWK